MGDGVEGVEKRIGLWSWYVGVGGSIHIEMNVGCMESSGRGLRWDCRLGLRGLHLVEYTWKEDVLQMPLVGSDPVGQRKD